MKVVTIATDLRNHALRRLLMPSCAAVGLELVILCPAAGGGSRGHGRPPVAPGSVARRVDNLAGWLPFNLADKRVILSTYLSQLPEHDELIVFTDAYDTMFVGGEAHIRAAHAAFAEPVVFSAEVNCWPLGVVGLALYDDAPVAPHPYLNSGGLIGTAADILRLYARYPEPPSERFELLRRLRAHGYDADSRFGWSDQYYWTLVHLLERDVIGLDHRAALFECCGAPYPDIDQAVGDGAELAAHGAEAPAYRRERERLRERLEVPSAAAQVHFCSSVTKAVALDLLDEGLLPAWLTRALGASPAGGGRARVHLVR
jgi:hypothetical protein